MLTFVYFSFIILFICGPAQNPFISTHSSCALHYKKTRRRCITADRSLFSHFNHSHFSGLFIHTSVKVKPSFHSYTLCGESPRLVTIWSLPNLAGGVARFTWYGGKQGKYLICYCAFTPIFSHLTQLQCKDIARWICGPKGGPNKHVYT